MIVGVSYQLMEGWQLRAKIQHVGIGKFKILAADNGDKYISNIVDASDVFSCKREWLSSELNT